MAEPDKKSGAAETELDEMSGHRFLESRGETHTVREMRNVLREIDIANTRNPVPRGGKILPSAEPCRQPVPAAVLSGGVRHEVERQVPRVLSMGQR
eukprot:319448_1